MIALTETQKQRLLLLEHEGRLLQDAVIDDARDEASPLHELFEWDREKAFVAHLLDTARLVIRSFRVTVTTETMTVKIPRYVRDPDLEGGQRGYIAVDALKTNLASARQAVANEFSRAEGVLRRALGLAAGLGLEEEIDQLLQQLAVMRAAVIPPEAAETAVEEGGAAQTQ